MKNQQIYLINATGVPLDVSFPTHDQTNLILPWPEIQWATPVGLKLQCESESQGNLLN